MRNVTKLATPDVLATNCADWTEQFVADPTNSTKRYRYRHPDIKRRLIEETHSKCAYCESKVGHNTPGDVEHKTPSSVNINRHFEWENLTIACTECNRRKLAYFDDVKPFLDPYADNVEARVVHHGPILGWLPGDDSAEITVRTLELHGHTRVELIRRKVELIDQLNNLAARFITEQGVLKDLIGMSIQRLKERDAEFSGMVCAVCERYGL